MTQRIQKPKPEPQEEKTAQAEETKKPQEDAEDLDALLDEIDEVLEKNAEEFVKAYIQGGGE